MRSLVIAAMLVCSTAYAQPSTTGVYAGWSECGWFPHGRLEEQFSHKDNGAQFSGFLGLRWRHVAIEVWDSPAMQSGISARGVDAKVLWPLGQYFSAYARLRLGQMTVDLDPYSDWDRQLTGWGGGEAAGAQANVAGRFLGFGPLGTAGFFFELGHERYELGTGGAAKPEGFWRYGYGMSWGGAF